MIVECPRCNARYRVDDDVVADEPTYKCSRCSHFFGQEAVALVAAVKKAGAASNEKLEPEPAPEELEAPERKPATRVGGRSDADSLSLPFSTSRTADEPAREPEPTFEPDEEYTLDSDDDDVSGEFAIGATGTSEPRFVRAYDERPAAKSSDRVRRPYLIFIGVVLLVFGNLALYLRNHPSAAERFLAAIPFAGRILVENRLLQSRVYLRDVEGVYQQIKDGRTVFIVTGRAINTAEAPLKGVEIESALYDSGGAPVAVKSIYCGNAMSLKIVKDLSSKEISILQRLQPPQRFEIAPGDAAGFSVVFLDPPAGFKEFSARVTAAQPTLS